ncbi:DUF3576 domain-containing protein [uncultured Gammaproteobacteria bacterium]
MTRRSSPPVAVFCLVVLSLVLSACGMLPGGKTETIEERDKQTMYKHGSLFGGEGGIQLFGPKRRDDPSQSGGIGVNSFLWRAALDTLAFMPIASADPFGGVILTDWHSPPDTPNERFKINLYILDRQLRADAIKTSVFKQVKRGADDWRDTSIGAETATQLEDAILTRARQLRIAQAGS